MNTSKSAPTTAARVASMASWAAGTAFLACSLSVLSAGAASPELLSARQAIRLLPAGGNGNSTGPIVTPDGRFVLFSSQARDLVTNENSRLGADVFLRDRRSNTTTLVSANYLGTGGGNGNSRAGSISANGRYVAYQSTSTDLLPGDTNAFPTDVYVRDLWLGTNILASAGLDGGWATGASYDPVMTPNGRYVVFVSTATNLVANFPGMIYNPEVYVRDLVAGTTTWVSVGGGYPTTLAVPIVAPTPAITPDGRFVAFYSTATNLVAGLSSTLGDIYIRDLVTGTTTCASSNGVSLATTALGVVNASSTHPAVSDDGRFVAFKSGTSNAAVVALFDSVTGTTTLVSTNGARPAGGIDDVYGPEMTPDGRFIAYAALDAYSNAVLYSSVHLWDAWTGEDTVLSLAQDGSFPTNTIAKAPAFSPDGNFVAFLSNATNLVTNAVSSGFHIYLRDLLDNTTVLVDSDLNGMGSTDEGRTVPSVGYDGEVVAFCSGDGNLVSGDTNGFLDVFLRNVASGMTELVSQRNPEAVPQTGSGLSSLWQNPVTPDGRWVVFVSRAEDLVTNDFNGAQDVFVHDMLTGTNILVSVGLDGNAGTGGDSGNPVISADGRYVSFQSRATNLTATAFATNSYFYANIYQRDLLTGTTVLVSTGTDGVGPSFGDSTLPAMSQDGRYLAFLSRGTNLGVSGTYWRDMNSTTNIYLPTSTYSRGGPSLSRDGRYVAYPDTLSRWFVWDSQIGSTIYTASTAYASAALSPDGKRLLYFTGSQVRAADVPGNVDLVSFPSTVTIRPAGQWGSDGRFFVFVTLAALVPGDGNGTNDVYLYDLVSGTLTLVSVNSSFTGSANARSEAPVISADGHYVVFRSFATDIAPGITNRPNLVVFDRLSNTLPATESPGWDWSSWVARPGVSDNGNTIAFLSWQSLLVPGDFNRLPDVFTWTQTPAVAVDSDSDGIPDWWLMQYFGHPTGEAGDLSLAQDDADGDGMTNLQEYLAGTDPRDPKSVFGVQISAVTTNGSVVLSWGAAPGRGYQVLFKNNLEDPDWQVAPGPTLVAGYQGSYSVPADQASRYYRVLAILE